MNETENLIINYQPTAEAINLLQNMRVALLVGITGAGKDAIKNGLLQTGHYQKIITTIPRPMRPHEQNGVDYYFINDETALNNLREHKYFEAKLVHDRVYGTTTAELERINNSGKIAIGDVDVQGVDEYVKATNNLTAIFIVPPSYETWHQRLVGRGDESPQETARRTKSAIMELNHALARHYYKFVINDDLGEAIQSIDQIIRGENPTYDDRPARTVAQDLLEYIVATEQK